VCVFSVWDDDGVVCLSDVWSREWFDVGVLARCWCTAVLHCCVLLDALLLLLVDVVVVLIHMTVLNYFKNKTVNNNIHS
jgi:hypothetical protein